MKVVYKANQSGGSLIEINKDTLFRSMKAGVKGSQKQHRLENDDRGKSSVAICTLLKQHCCSVAGSQVSVRVRVDLLSTTMKTNKRAKKTSYPFRLCWAAPQIRTDFAYMMSDLT